MKKSAKKKEKINQNYIQQAKKNYDITLQVQWLLNRSAKNNCREFDSLQPTRQFRVHYF